MPTFRQFIKYWLPVLVWMWLIYLGSSDQSSFQRSSRLLGSVISWLLPGLSDQSLEHVIILIRKCGHVTEYAILAVLVWWALGRGSGRPGTVWSWREAGLTLALVVVYAVSDEIHQTFVPSRQGTITDVLIDTSGGALGLLLAWTILRLRSRRLVGSAGAASSPVLPERTPRGGVRRAGKR